MSLAHEIAMSVLTNRIAVALFSTATVVLASCATEKPATPEPASPKSGATTTGPSCNPKVGAKAPALTMETFNGPGKVAIAPGKVTLVDFWATWCRPCEASFPKYEELYVKYKSKGFELIAVNMDDDKKDIAAFLKKSGAKFPVGWDKGHAVAECWKPPNMPSAYIIDKKGVVRHIHREWKNGHETIVEEEIKALL
jgi:cytochrome c biogenesis protein CcmG, thiol:disulfide interchange protein DsbE